MCLRYVCPHRSGHHRIKDHHANSALKRLSLKQRQFHAEQPRQQVPSSFSLRCLFRLLPWGPWVLRRWRGRLTAPPLRSRRRMRLCGCHQSNACVSRTILVLAFHGTVSSARRCLILMSLWSPLFWEKGGSIDSCGFVCGRGLFENPRIHTTGVDTAALDSTFSSRLQITNMLKFVRARYEHLFYFDVLSERI